MRRAALDVDQTTTQTIANCKLQNANRKSSEQSNGWKSPICNLQFAFCNLSLQPKSQRHANRRGLTLYEVMLALAIFLPAMVVITRGITTGTQAGLNARLQAEAALRCDSLMSEVIAGVVPLQAVAEQEFEDLAPGWTWSLVIGTGPHPDLLAIEATVEHRTTSGELNASATMTRLARDPQVFTDAALLQQSQQSTGASP